MGRQLPRKGEWSSRTVAVTSFLEPNETKESLVMLKLLRCLVCAAFLINVGGMAQEPSGSGEALSVLKVDPPSWYSGLPQPLLLVRGTGFKAAQFTLSDTSLQIERIQVSANGHWAQLWLTASPNQPETVQLTVTHGRQSATVPYTFAAPRAATEGMRGFSPRDVIYLIMTDRFADGDSSNDGLHATSAASSADALVERAKPRGWHGGDIQGVLNHLDYLQQLGITTIWLTPVYTNAEPAAYHGYHTTDYYGVDPHLGTLITLQQLAKTLHTRGMKLVLDTVPNHVGPGHPWVTDEPAPDWFHGTATNHLKAEANFSALLNPHAPERDRRATLEGWFADALPDMNTDSPAVAQYLRQNAVWWIEQTGADGLRIDTFPFVNRDFWNGFNGELKKLFPHLTEVGEVFNPHAEITSAFADGVTRNGVDTYLYTPFDFPTYFAARKVFGEGQPMSELADVLAMDALYVHPERLVPFLGNHDTSRFAEVVPDPAVRRLAFAYLLTTRGTPQIYSGDEIAMTGGDDPDDRRDFPGGFPGPGSTTNGFSLGSRTPEQQASYSWIKQLVAVRHEHEVLMCGAEQVLAADRDSLAYARFGNEGCGEASVGGTQERILVILRRGANKPLSINLKATALDGLQPGTPLLGEAELHQEGGHLLVTLAESHPDRAPSTASFHSVTVPRWTCRSARLPHCLFGRQMNSCVRIQRMSAENNGAPSHA